MIRAISAICLLTLLAAGRSDAQTVTYRGFVEARGIVFPADTPQDTHNVVVDLLGRGELFVRPTSWLQFAGGLDARENSHEQVADDWRVDIRDRGIRRSPLSVRRLSATLTHRWLTVDAGKQFIRWGKADIVTPTDRFAPRDFTNVLDTEFLAVTGARGVVESGSHTVDAVWVPWFTPSRLPLLNQRWSSVPPGLEIVDSRDEYPDGSQVGVRWGYVGSLFESSLSFYDGYNHLPNIESGVLEGQAGARPAPGPGVPPVIPLRVRYPVLRMYGADAAIPNPWFTVKGEAGYFTTSTAATDEYVLYVVQLERQTGEWVFIGGYAGEIVTKRRAAQTFAPDRGTARTLLGRVSYTLDANRSAAVESAVRQNGAGLYVKGEYSQARGSHWRATLTATLIRGESADFLGQYSRNSNVALALRYSF